MLRVLLWFEFHVLFVLLWLSAVLAVVVAAIRHRQPRVPVLPGLIAAVKRQTLHEIVGLVVSVEVQILQLALRDPKVCIRYNKRKTTKLSKMYIYKGEGEGLLLCHIIMFICLVTCEKAIPQKREYLATTL